MNIRRVSLGLLAASMVAVVLFIVGALRNHTLDYWYLPYNLFLAAIPFALAAWLRRLLESYDWKNWRTICLAVGWLLFLPNSFYIVTDYIHLPETQRVDIVQDVVMLAQFSIIGFIFGFLSLSMLHEAYAKYLKPRLLTSLVYGVLFLASFAIYLGRELRWNSWDVVSNPAGLFSDVWSIVIYPFAHAGMISITLSYFIVLASLYWLLGILKGTPKKE